MQLKYWTILQETDFQTYTNKTLQTILHNTERTSTTPP